MPEKSIDPVPDANIAFVAPENVVVPVIPIAPEPIVTAPVDVLNKPELPEKSIAPVPDDKIAFVAPENVVVPVRVAEETDINGMQFTISFDNSTLALIAIDPAGINVNDSNFGLRRTGEGLLTVSWNGSKPLNLKKGDVIFNITFVAKDKGNLSDLLKVNSDVTSAEAYNSDNKVMDVVFSVQDRGKETVGFDLMQNTPNPFKETTIIGFELPADMQANITVYDISVRVLRNNKIQGIKGYNVIELNKSELHSGVMYYTLRAGEYNATRKMVVIE